MEDTQQYLKSGFGSLESVADTRSRSPGISALEDGSQTGCVRLGEEDFRREYVPIGGLHQLRKSKVQSFFKQRPPRCVAEGEDAGSIGLEELIASLVGLTSEDLSPSCPRHLTENRC